MSAWHTVARVPSVPEVMYAYQYNSIFIYTVLLPKHCINIAAAGLVLCCTAVFRVFLRLILNQCFLCQDLNAVDAKSLHNYCPTSAPLLFARVGLSLISSGLCLLWNWRVWITTECTGSKKAILVVLLIHFWLLYLQNMLHYVSIFSEMFWRQKF